MEKGTAGYGCFCQGKGAVHAAGKHRAGHAADAVRLGAGGGQLIIGLLVRPGVARGSEGQSLGNNCHLFHTLLFQGDRGIQASRATAYNYSLIRLVCKVFFHIMILFSILRELFAAGSGGALLAIR